MSLISSKLKMLLKMLEPYMQRRHSLIQFFSLGEPLEDPACAREAVAIKNSTIL